MLRTLLSKDLRRVRRNPIPWLIQIAIPILITTMIGLAFGPKSNPSGFGRIRIAVVDEDDSGLSRFIRGALSGQKGPINIDVSELDRAGAMRLVGANKLSAVIALPAGFEKDYLDGNPVRLELVKNPAQSLQPTVVEEFMGLLTTGLNVLQRTAGPDLVTWRTELEKSEAFDPWTVGLLYLETVGRMKPARDFLVPPLVQFSEATVAASASSGEAKPKFHLFAFLLLGMAAMFLLYIADNAVRDLYREFTGRTLARFRTVHHSLTAFISAKVVFAVVMVLIGALVILGGGMVIFGFEWRHVPQMTAMLAAYAIFAAGFMALIAGLAGNERRAGMFNNILVMGMALGGGAMFPLDMFGAFWRDQVAPWIPIHWFLETMRRMQYMSGDVAWTRPALQLLVAGVVCVALASWLFRRRLELGVKS